MGATDREFQAQSAFIAACDDPNTLLDWMREYRDGERAAVGRGDEEAARQMDDLAELAEDRAIELKAAQILASRPKPQVPEAQPSASPRPTAQVDNSAVELRKVKEELAASREAQAKAEREQARAERERVAAVERAEQQGREAVAAKVAADKAAEATAPAVNLAPLVPHNRSPEREAVRERVRENERLRLAAARAVAVQKPAVAPPSRMASSQPAPDPRPAATPGSARSAAATPTTTRPSPVPQTTLAHPAPRPPAALPTPTAAPVAELTPLARLFQRRLTETTPALPAARPQPPSPPETRRPATPATPPLAALPPADPLAAVPQHTGADLVAYRMWLGVDQRALAAKFGVGQGTISKGESRPTTLLGPALRKALHEAMSEPRQDVGGTP